MMEPTHQKKAVIYCRAASVPVQAMKNTCVKQAHHCEHAAKSQGYQVVNTFEDIAVSGNTLDRPGLKAMLAFLRNNNDESYTVIVEDEKRLARDYGARAKLYAQLKAVNACVNSITPQRMYERGWIVMVCSCTC